MMGDMTRTEKHVWNFPSLPLQSRAPGKIPVRSRWKMKAQTVVWHERHLACCLCSLLDLVGCWEFKEQVCGHCWVPAREFPRPSYTECLDVCRRLEPDLRLWEKTCVSEQDWRWKWVQVPWDLGSAGNLLPSRVSEGVSRWHFASFHLSVGGRS
jgi:hypothetical protein